jgi:antitoxin ParD1/3/4
VTRIKLAPEVESFVNEQVGSGAASSADDYVNDVLRARRDEELAAEDELWAEAQIGIDDIEAGRYLPIDEAFNEVRSRLGLKPKSR